MHHETPRTTSPLGFGLKWVLHKEAQQQLRKIFKFLLACFILETYPMQMFRDIKKKKIKDAQNLCETRESVVKTAGSCCVFTLGLKPAQFVHH